MAGSPVLILDNGGGSIKAGWAVNREPTFIVPNVTAKVKKSMEYLIGTTAQDYLNGSQLTFTRPFDRGYLNNWKCELDIWTSLFHDHLRCSPATTSLVLTEPPLNPTSIQNETNEIVFEYYGFQEYTRRPAIWFSAYGAVQNKEWNTNDWPACTVVDSGFSFSHSACFVEGRCVRASLRRVNVGGKLLTNYLKELVSYRQWNMMDEFLLMNQVKEALCYIEPNAIAALRPVKYSGRAAKAAASLDWQHTPLRKNFVLPDFQHVNRGYVKPDDEPANPTEQLLVMETERFSVPEVLFFPADVGLRQAGVAESAADSVSSLDNPLHAEAAVQTVLLTGGNTKFPGFRVRFEQEMRSGVCADYEMNVTQPTSPETYAWLSARQYIEDVRAGRTSVGCHRVPGQARTTTATPFVTKAMYQENGHDYCNRIFDSMW